MSLTKQEMFDRAYRGLASQDFKRAVDGNDDCVYLNADGLRCAWGWVDPDGTVGHIGSVAALKSRCIGLAKLLGGDELAFARSLQNTHDLAKDPLSMRSRLRSLADEHSLSIPELP